MRTLGLRLGISLFLLLVLLSSAWGQVPKLRQFPPDLPPEIRESLEQEVATLHKQLATLGAKNMEFRRQYGSLPENSPLVPEARRLQAELEADLKHYGEAVDVFNAKVDAAVQQARAVVFSQGPTTPDEVRQTALAYAERGGFDTPLADSALCAFLVAEAKRAGVPVWLILIQARRETSFGDGTKNHTVMEGQLFTDGTRGNAHNLFNIRPGDK